MKRSSGQVRKPQRAQAIISARIELLEPRRLLSAALSNTPLTDDPGVQQQPSIAVDPHASQRLAVTYLDSSLVSSGYEGIGVATSRDGGRTWMRSHISLPAGFDQGAAYPIAKFDDRGGLFVSFMAITFLRNQPPISDPSVDPLTGVAYFTDVFSSNNGIFVVRSSDGGLTWSAPVTVASHRYDGRRKVLVDKKPELAIDTFRTLPNGRTNPNYGNIYVVWVRYYPAGQFPDEPDSTGGSAIQIAASTDGGASFQERHAAPTAGHSHPASVFHDISYSGIGSIEGTGGVSYQSQFGSRLQFELLDETGQRVLAGSTPIRNKHGHVVGERINFPSAVNQEYLLCITSRAALATDYNLNLQALTADLGTVVDRSQSGQFSVGDQAYYLVSAGKRDAGKSQVNASTEPAMQSSLPTEQAFSSEPSAPAEANHAGKDSCRGWMWGLLPLAAFSVRDLIDRRSLGAKQLHRHQRTSRRERAC